MRLQGVPQFFKRFVFAHFPDFKAATIKLLALFNIPFNKVCIVDQLNDKECTNKNQHLVLIKLLTFFNIPFNKDFIPKSVIKLTLLSNPNLHKHDL